MTGVKTLVLVVLLALTSACGNGALITRSNAPRAVVDSPYATIEAMLQPALAKRYSGLASRPEYLDLCHTLTVRPEGRAELYTFDFTFSNANPDEKGCTAEYWQIQGTYNPTTGKVNEIKRTFKSAS